MTNDTRTPDAIERDIADERTQMSDTINDLQKKFSVEAIVNDLGDMFRDQGGELGRSISQTVGRNPAAVVLIGVGLAWLIVGKNRQHAANTSDRQPGHEPGGRRDLPASAGWDSRALPRHRSPDGPFHSEDQYWYDGGQTSGDRRAQGGTEGGAQQRSHTDGASNGMMGTIRNASGAVGDAVSDAAGSLGRTASSLTERLSDGLDNLSDEAKSRVLSARRAAHEARLSSGDAMDRASRTATNLFEDQPLVVGALAVALGAAIGGALPHSRIEDDAMGESSDRLFAEAQAVFREERDKAMAVARTAAGDVRDEIGKMGSELRSEVDSLLPEDKNLGDVIVDHAADAAARVVDGAQDEAERQGLGRRET